MEITKRTSSLNEERGQTDSSLITERGKTDVSLADHRQQTESKTDQKVKKDRLGADSVRAQERINADATTDLGRSGRTKIQKNRTNDEMAADNTLRDQRNRDDAAVDAERSLMDAAMDHEREINDLESNKFLERERKATDKNLLRERTHTDSDVVVSSRRLSHEMSSHKATKAALTSRDELLAIVSHDLRNPIGAILSYADLLLEDSPREDEESKRWASVIKRNAESSLRLINDILDMERFAEGKLNMNFKLCDFNALVKNTVESFAHLASERNVKLSAVLSQTIPHINCDRDRIEQVLANLIGNALKFTPPGGSITIHATELKDLLRISVTDTGVGVPIEQTKRIFDRYTQLGDKDRQGLGLGLYISTMLVEAHHGKLEVESTPGKGSTFSFSLPV